MRIRWSYPSTAALQEYVRQQSALAFTYPTVGATQASFPTGFQHDRTTFEISQRAADWQKAKNALLTWVQFDNGWSQVFPAQAALKTDQTVAVLFQIYGFWWINACRVVYTVDEANRFGFAYGTLPGHVEMGEEYFGIYRQKDGSIHFEINAFSKPRHWLVRLGAPLARYWQQRFVREAGNQMRQALNTADQ